MNVEHILADKKAHTIWSVKPSNTVYEALELMAQKNIGAVPVLENDRLAGIFSERDYARKGILMGRASKDTLINDVMTRDVITVERDISVEKCMRIMSDKHIRHLPVVEKTELVGIISINDIVTAIINDQKDHIQSLQKYISGSY